MKKPVLVKSDDRRQAAKQHPRSGKPEEWLNSTISFDFFVNWSDWTFQKEIWVKGILEEREVPPDEGVEEFLRKYDADFDILRNFANRYQLDLHYMVFDDTQDWKQDRSVIYDIHFDGNQAITDVVSLKHIKERIFKLSRGPAPVGSKGLLYSTSRLEEELSHTNYAWPGDVDGIILSNSDQTPLAILEYKKHTKAGEYGSASIYYPTKDKRKYNRLEILRNAVNPGIPVIVVTFPTRVEFTELMLECIQVDLSSQNMHIISKIKCELPDQGICDPYKRAVYELMKQWNRYCCDPAIAP